MTPTKDANSDHVCEHGTAMDVHCCNCHSGFIFNKNHECPEPATPAPFDFVERLRLAQQQVRSSPLYRKFIDGTPLENDVAVWMTTFAAQAVRDYVRHSVSDTALRACAEALAPPSLEICICAAVQFADGRIVRGHRHDACFITASGWTPTPPRDNNIQGFITSRNRFVNRTEGARLQREAGHLSAHTGQPVNDELFSEDLYFDTHDHVAWNTPYQEPPDALAPPELEEPCRCAKPAPLVPGAKCRKCHRWTVAAVESDGSLRTVPSKQDAGDWPPEHTSEAFFLSISGDAPLGIVLIGREAVRKTLAEEFFGPEGPQTDAHREEEAHRWATFCDEENHWVFSHGLPFEWHENGEDYGICVTRITAPLPAPPRADALDAPLDDNNER